MSHKMYVRFYALVIKSFEFARELDEKSVPLKEVTMSNCVALKGSDTSYESAEIEPVFTRQEVSKECRAKTIDILLELPSFIASVELLGRVPGSSSERGGYEWYCPYHGFSMGFPKSIVLVENSPVPCRLIVRLINVDSSSKKFDE